MNQILLVAKREFLSQVKNKTFIILTISMPFIMVLFGVVVAWMGKANEGLKNIGYIDQSGLFVNDFQSDKDKTIGYHLYDASEEQAILDTLANSEYLNALLVIPKTKDLKKIEKETILHTNGTLGFNYLEKIQDKINAKIETNRLAEHDIDKDILAAAKGKIDLKVFNVKEEGKEEKGAIAKLIVSGVFIYIIFMFIMIYGVRVMRSVVEEKNNRVVEVIISSLKPMNLMLGKIFGMAAVAVFQFAIWITMGGILLIISSFFLPKSSTSDVEQAQKMLSENPDIQHKIVEAIEVVSSLNIPLILIMFFILFVLGYLFYSAIFAAIGSAVDTDTDTQQFTFLPMIPLMLGVYGAFFSLISDPSGPVAFWLSMIPFTSPIAMMMRIPFGVPWWQLVLSITLLAGSTFALIYFAAKIYRVGILMYGKKASFKELWKWMRYS